MITIICVGNIKENYLREAIKDYEKRIKKFHKIKIIEIPDYPNTNKEIILTKEKDKIISNLKPKDYIITLEIEGNQTTSLELSKKINNLFNYHSNIVFIIGGSHGLHQEIKKKSNYKLSFSPLTFPHQLFRIILLEQLYRIFKIIHNETYHK